MGGERAIGAWDAEMVVTGVNMSYRWLVAGRCREISSVLYMNLLECIQRWPKYCHESEMRTARVNWKIRMTIR